MEIFSLANAYIKNPRVTEQRKMKWCIFGSGIERHNYFTEFCKNKELIFVNNHKNSFLLCFKASWSKFCFATALCGRRTKDVKYLITRTVHVTGGLSWINEAAIISPQCGWLRLILGLHSMVFIIPPEINRAQTNFNMFMHQQLKLLLETVKFLPLVIKDSTVLNFFFVSCNLESMCA